MKTAFVVLAAAGIVAAQDLTGVPKCAQECIAIYVPQIGCSLTDTACQCKQENKDKLTPIITPCMTSKCSPAELAQALTASDAICKALSASPTPSATASPTASGTETETEAPETTDTETAEPTMTGPVTSKSNVTKTEATPTPTTTKSTATSAVVTAGAAHLPAMAGAGLLALLGGAIAAL